MSLKPYVLRALLVAALASAACSDSPSGVVTPTPTNSAIAYSSTIGPGGFAWRSFDVEKNSKVTVQFFSMSPDLTAVVRLGLGTFDGTTCTPVTSLDTAIAASDPQITSDLAIGSYCVRIADIGNVKQISQFSILVVMTFS